MTKNLPVGTFTGNVWGVLPRPAERAAEALTGKRYDLALTA